MNIVIPINRNRFPIALILFFALTLLSTLNLIYTKTEGMYMDGLFNWIFNSVILLIFLTYTIISLVDFVKTKFNKSAALIISDTGLNDNLSIFSCGKILWSDISDVEIANAFTVDFIIVKLLDSNKYLAEKNFLQRSVLKRYIRKWGTPIIISEKRVNYDLNELKQIILMYKKAE